MRHKETIQDFLRTNSPRRFTNSELASFTRIKPHQQVFQKTQLLFDSNQLQRAMRGREWEFWIDSAKLPSPNKVVIESYERRVASEPPSHDTPEAASAFDSQGCVALLSCVKSKQNAACRAEHMYTSSLFRKMLAYARTLNPKAIYILSARYGLLALDKKIEPYEKTLKSMSPHHKSEWATGVIRDLRQKCDLAHDRFVILAGEGYRKGLVSSIEHYWVPMDGLSFGQQLRWLGENTP